MQATFSLLLKVLEGLKDLVGFAVLEIWELLQAWQVWGVWRFYKFDGSRSLGVLQVRCVEWVKG